MLPIDHAGQLLPAPNVLWPTLQQPPCHMTLIKKTRFFY